MFGMSGPKTHFRRIHGVCVGVAVGHVDAERLGRRGALVVDRHPLAVEGDAAADRKLLVEAARGHLARPGAPGGRIDGGADRACRAGHDLARNPRVALLAVLAGEVDDLPARPPAARGHPFEVPDDLVRHPDVARDEPPDEGVAAPPAGVAGDRDPEALLEDLAAEGRVEGAPDVRPVGGDRDEPDEGAAGEDRGRHGDVLEVAGADPRVVGDDEVAFAPVRRRVLGEERVEGPGQGADEGGARDRGLGEGPSVPIEHHHREVLRLADGDGVGGADHGRRRLVHDREEPAPDDLDVARRESVLLRRRVRVRLRCLPHRRLLLRLCPRPPGRRHLRSRVEVDPAGCRTRRGRSGPPASPPWWSGARRRGRARGAGSRAESASRRKTGVST